MALNKSQDTSFGIVVKNAYSRVESLRLLSKEKMQFNACTYSDVDAAPFMSNLYSCAYSINGQNPIAQAYAHLKTTEDFSDAVDC